MKAARTGTTRSSFVTTVVKPAPELPLPPLEVGLGLEPDVLPLGPVVVFPPLHSSPQSQPYKEGKRRKEETHVEKTRM